MISRKDGETLAYLHLDHIMRTGCIDDEWKKSICILDFVIEILSHYSFSLDLEKCNCESCIARHVMIKQSRELRHGT